MLHVVHFNKNQWKNIIKLSIKFKFTTVSKTLVSRRERWSVHITHLITIHVTIRHWCHQLTLQLFLWFVPWRQRNTKETCQTSWIIFWCLCFVTLQTREKEREKERERERERERREREKRERRRKKKRKKKNAPNVLSFVIKNNCPDFPSPGFALPENPSSNAC